MKTRTEPAESPNEARRLELLETALGVFLRYGFRKTSMDDVARAAGLSRQGLYLYFSSKEVLFRAGLTLILDRSLDAGKAALDDESRGIEDRLLAAVDAMFGQHVETLGAASHQAELIEASETLVGELIDEQEKAFRAAVARALKVAGVTAAWEAWGLSGRDLAETLVAAAHGAKYRVPSRAAYTERVKRAVRLVCRPAAK